MPNPPALADETVYHIFNRGTNRENLFIEERNYPYFLALYQKHIVPFADTYAFCLLSNHFHLLIKTKPRTGTAVNKSVSAKHLPNPSQQFSRLFNAYAKAINKTYNRTGSLFEHPFRRVVVTNREQFQQTLLYIHLNPRKHHFVDDFCHWPYSSYPLVTPDAPAFVCRDQILKHFGGLVAFEQRHVEYEDSARWLQTEFEENIEER